MNAKRRKFRHERIATNVQGIWWKEDGQTDSSMTLALQSSLVGDNCYHPALEFHHRDHNLHVANVSTYKGDRQQTMIVKDTCTKNLTTIHRPGELITCIKAETLIKYERTKLDVEIVTYNKQSKNDLKEECWHFFTLTSLSIES